MLSSLTASGDSTNGRVPVCLQAEFDVAEEIHAISVADGRIDELERSHDESVISARLIVVAQRVRRPNPVGRALVLQHADAAVAAGVPAGRVGSGPAALQRHVKGGAEVGIGAAGLDL